MRLAVVSALGATLLCGQGAWGFVPQVSQYDGWNGKDSIAFETLWGSRRRLLMKIDRSKSLTDATMQA